MDHRVEDLVPRSTPPGAHSHGLARIGVRIHIHVRIGTGIVDAGLTGGGLASSAKASCAACSSSSTSTNRHPRQSLKGIDKGPPEAGVHETVCDRIAAGRRVGQELEEADGRIVHVLVHHRSNQHRQRVDHIERGPADEELQHQDEQHLHHPLLALQGLGLVGSGSK